MSDKAPAEVTLRVCPVCGRTDRYQSFTGKSHYTRAGKCPGQPEWVRYVLTTHPEEKP